VRKNEPSGERQGEERGAKHGPEQGPAIAHHLKKGHAEKKTATATTGQRYTQRDKIAKMQAQKKNIEDPKRAR